MSKKVIPLEKLEDTLADLFALSDGENSEDDNESDEDENEAVFSSFTSTEPEDILFGSGLNESQPTTSTVSILPSSPNMDISATHDSITGSTQPTPSNSRMSSITRPVTPVVTQADDTDNSEDSSENNSEDDGDEEWKKVQFPHIPPTEKFDEILLRPSQFFPNRTQNRQKDWDIVTLQELKAFFGILILMGIHVLPNISLYWSSDPTFRVAEIANVMTVKRFKKILANLHLNDNSQMPKRGEERYDKLYKIRPMIKILNSAFQSGGVCSSSQSIDECMIKFKGRSTLKQYMPKKPVKRGFKVWSRCDSLTGYLYQFEIYTGKKDDATTEVGLGASVVRELSKNLIDENVENTHIAFDNFFASHELLQYLFDNNIYATATVRADRTNLPKLIKNQKKKKDEPKPPPLVLAKGEYKWRVNQNVAFFVWKDTKLVYVLSTAYHPRQKTCRRTQKDGSKSNVSCPIGILEYTKRMGGVDRFDQKRGTYSISRRSKRWWMRIFYFLVDSAITNAYIIYTQNDRVHNPMTSLHFRTVLARNLIDNFSSRKRTVAQSPNFVTKKPKGPTSRQKAIHGIPDELRLNDVGSHMPMELPKYRRCRACSSKNLNKTSKIQCTKCQVPLCIVPCFAQFHTP
ncbi:unnamed protein product [Parnassius apollo]|uniref:(apollo) hypothetical protein n=1 Tax=Parnassius apollo TaxID=110799 RepID=A0A8S3WJ37_PARAO|nr:unnamed protein product [Parnassius apollo]